MAVKLRLARRGRKRYPIYDVVAADVRAPRDGRFIEKVGQYNPNTHPATIRFKEEVALKWLLNGAQPTNTVRNILSTQGIMLRKHLQVGVHKGAITQEEADKRWNAWKEAQDAKNPLQTKETKIGKEHPKAAKDTAKKVATTQPAKQKTAAGNKAEDTQKAESDSKAEDTQKAGSDSKAEDTSKGA